MRVATDIGGTFTDLVAISEDGALVQEKAHTTPPNFEAGVMDVLEKSGVSPESITAFFHGTTTIINANNRYCPFQISQSLEQTCRKLNRPYARVGI